MYRPAGRPAPLPAPLPRKRGSPPGTATLRGCSAPRYRLLHCHGGQGTQTTIPAQEGIGCCEPPEGGGKSKTAAAAAAATPADSHDNPDASRGQHSVLLQCTLDVECSKSCENFGRLPLPTRGRFPVCRRRNHHKAIDGAATAAAAAAVIIPAVQHWYLGQQKTCIAIVVPGRQPECRRSCTLERE